MREINTGAQEYEDIVSHNDFYIDKTMFIKEWWENRDKVTLITRPRRFGKTLNMDMLKCFFSNQYAGRSDLFEGMNIWKDEKYRELQGTYPVIFLSFADIKLTTFEQARESIILTLQSIFRQFEPLWKNDPDGQMDFMTIKLDSSDAVVTRSLQQASEYLAGKYHKKVLILLDEYDTPLQEAYMDGYWDEMSAFMRSLFNSTFKSNMYLERAILTGVTRVSKESIFSDLNNLKVITTTSEKYETCFGFTQEEVDSALQEYHLSDSAEEVKRWYDGFTFGRVSNIYNPWSILQFLDNNGEFEPYWANTSSNNLISHELRTADDDIKSQMEVLMNGGTVETEVDEQIIYSQLEENSEAIWSLFLASGYLKVVRKEFVEDRYQYVLSLTNYEVKMTFRNLIRNWFGNVKRHYNGFIKGLIDHNDEAIQTSLNDVLSNAVSFYDTGTHKTVNERAESFYHGLVLGMIAQESEYHITSNRESGYGRYDIMMKPLEKNLPGIIIEFKVFDQEKEKSLKETAERALTQIREKKYDSELIQDGIPAEKIIHYGMGFRGKKVEIRSY